MISASRMPSSHVSPQVCRPHFHAPLPWLSEPHKPLGTSSGAWSSPFACPQDPQDKLSSQSAAAVQSSQAAAAAAAAGSQHLFSFPPTPPKDSTPDSVQTGPSEYQAAVNAFMHQAQVVTSQAALGTESSCGLDIKPCLTGGGGGGGGGGQSKQREGTNATSNNNNSSNSNNNNSNNNNTSNTNNNNNNTSSSNSSLNNSLFGHHQSSYGGYDGYGYHQTGSAFQSSTTPNQSPHHTKPQRTKARTSAGKT